MATIETLKELLIQERVSRIIDSIPNGHCPNAYYNIDYLSGCMSEDENDNYTICKQRFEEAVIKIVTEEVMAL